MNRVLRITSLEVQGSIPRCLAKIFAAYIKRCILTNYHIYRLSETIIGNVSSANSWSLHLSISHLKINQNKVCKNAAGKFVINFFERWNAETSNWVQKWRLIVKPFAAEKSKKQHGKSMSSVVASAPTILRPQVRIPCTPSMFFSKPVNKIKTALFIGLRNRRK